MFQPVGKRLSSQEMLEHAATNTLWLKSTLGDQIKFGLENNNYYPTPAYEIVTDGDFITEVIRQNDLYLLLDIAHAMVTSHNMKIEYLEYVKSLPLDRLIQLHICVPELPPKGIGIDAHNSPDLAMEQRVVDTILEYPQIQFLTIEFYKDKDILIKCIESLQNQINKLKFK